MKMAGALKRAQDIALAQGWTDRGCLPEPLGQLVRDYYGSANPAPLDWHDAAGDR